MLGVSATLVSFAIMIALICDAVFDPIIGEISDNWRSHLGRRHPFMYGAAVPVAVLYFMLWNPPSWSSGALFFYLLVTANRMAIQPEDNAHAEIWEADPDYGHYSPHSWAPLMVGVSAAITFGGLAFAAWIFVAGAVLVIMSSAYWLFEYYTGPDAQF